MNFKKRLLYYLSGFSLGLIIVFSILGVRGCEWLPKTRIVTAINSTQLLVSKADLENIKCNTASDAIFSLINNGEIDFKKSNTEYESKKYFFTNDSLSAVIEINFNDSVSTILEINGLKKCSFEKNISLLPLYRSNASMLKILENLPIKNEEAFNCSIKYYSLDSNISKKILSEGNILFKHSLPKRKPNPLFIVEFQEKLSTYYALIQQGEKRIRLKKLIQNNNADEAFLNSLVISDKDSIPCE